MRRLAPLLIAGAALAHDVPHPRTEALRLSAAGISLRVDYEIGAGAQARALRQAFDRDHNGRLDPGEQHALAEHLARTATLRTELSVDGIPIALRRDAVRPEKLDEPASSTSLLAIRVALRGEWPPSAAPAKKKFFFLSAGDPHHLVLRDEDPSGHVPVAVICEKCRILESNSGVWEKSGDDEIAKGATASAAAPLTVVIRF